jgi:hypothetical protein
MEANSNVPTGAFSVIRLDLATSWLNATGTQNAKTRVIKNLIMASVRLNSRLVFLQIGQFAYNSHK